MSYLAPRFWLPYGKEISLVDQGFIYEAPAFWSDAYPAELNPLQDLAAIPCLVLIGEPGLGKSTAMRIEFTRLQSQLAGGPDRVQWVSLGTTREREVLSGQIFAAKPFQEWLAGDGHLHLFLDSLDEARLRIPRVAELLLEGLAGAPFGRLSLRLSCRSANRHYGLERGLREQFAASNFAEFELAPLTKRDVLAAASARDLEAETILTKIIERELQPLAMVPESLNFLLDVAEETGDLPTSRTEAYEQGLRLLVREPDEDRREEERDRLPSTQRLALASRIAAALVLSGRTSVRLDERPVGSDQASVAQFAGGSETDRVTALPVAVDATVANLTEVLHTALFTSHGERGHGFGQASYAEFLCARWLACGGLAPGQLEQLLFMESAEGLRVIPQLNEVAAWLADQDSIFSARLLECDPSVLLRAEPVNLDEGGRRQLVDALIAGIISHDVDRWDRRMRAKYPALRHPGLAAQLGAVIGDRDANSRARQVACDVAGACSLQALEPELTDIALDVSEDREARSAALSALGHIEDAKHRSRLRPLALEPLDDDPDDDLKGGALLALWPGELGAAELFASLSPPKRKNLLGQYKGFLFNQLLAGLEPEDLPIALAWAAKLPVDHFPTDALSDVRERLLLEAWPRLDVGGELLDRYADVIVGLLAGHANLLSSEAAKEHPEVFVEREGRRHLIRALISRLGDTEVEPGALVLSRPPLLNGADTAWLAQLLLDREAEGGEEAETLAHLLESLVSLGGEDEPVMQARESSSRLRRLTARHYDSVELGSAAAARARESYELWHSHRHHDEEEPLDLDIAGKVREALDRFEAGDVDGFWIATRWLEIDLEKKERAYLVSDLTRLPGWRLLEDGDRDRIRTAARSYLDGASPDPKSWFSRDFVNWPAWAGYRALRLLHSEGEQVGQALVDPALWARWAPIVVHWPRNDGDGEGEGAFNDWAIAQALAKAPGETVTWFSRALDRQLRKEGHPFILHRFRQVWHPLLEGVILRRARRSNLGAEQRTELLEVLLRNGSTEARAHARRLISSVALAGGERRNELAVRVAVLLAVEAGAGDWERIWALIETDEAFGISLVERLAAGERHRVGELSPRQAGELFSWILARYPYGGDPVEDEVHFVTAREQVGHYRDRILNMLGEGQSRESVAELGRLIAAHPELEFLPRLRRQAERRLQRSEWVPPAPQHVVRLAEDTVRRHVRSASDLRQIAIASLERAQERLSGLRPAIADLWDLGTVRPKRERLVGAWIERHLRDDLVGRGIIVGREVEVRAHPKGQMGESVDILLSAIAAPEIDGAPEVSVSLELKCCWNRDLETAMEGQLLDRYLDVENNQGLYVIAHFDSPQWEDGDAVNRSACRRRDFKSSRSFFSAQAAALSAKELADISAFVLDCSLPA
jgi:hypothetical protein